MTYRFLEQTVRIERGGWSRVHASPLWLYNLHYFDDLNAQGAEERESWHREAVNDWVTEVALSASPAWDPYPLSLRLVNWIKWLQGGVEPVGSWLQSLSTQAGELERRLEFHLGGNHLFSNAKALVFAGAFFEGGPAQTWMRRGLEILQREMTRQIVADGGHYERSPMYHALALEDVLDLVNLSRRYPDSITAPLRDFVDSWPGLACRMEAALGVMCHPDAEVAAFNDAAPGIAPPPAELRRYAADLFGRGNCAAPAAIEALPETGYVKLTLDDAVAIIDVAPVGPDELPGHAHADTLSFELSLRGRRVLVNGGTSTYDRGATRERERGTAAHNTVTIDGADSSEVWASFRVARRARPFDVETAHSEDGARVAASHDGYHRLRGRPTHRRIWILRPGAFIVEDQITGRFNSAVARFHLQPAAEWILDDTGLAGLLVLPDGGRVRWQSNVAGTIERSHYSPRFGLVVDTRCLELRATREGHLRLELNW
jgi:uncharacterized heparinase superfamily protein